MKQIVFLLFLLTLMPLSARADSAADVQQAQAYLNGMTTATARFLQTAPDGSQLIGTFYLDRPGKLRFEYDDPVEDFVVADGMLIYFYDAQLGEQSNAPIGQTLADFLLRPRLDLSGELTVTDVKEGKDMLQISLTQTADPAAGAIVLGFTREPFALKKWRITDSAGAITEIELFQLQTGVDLEDSLFVYVDPEKYGKPRYND